MGDQPIKSSSLLEETGALWHELHRLSYDHLRIVALETQRAGVSLVKLIIAGVMVALLLTATWLALLAIAVLTLVDYGIMANTALLMAVLFNLLMILFLLVFIRFNSRYLGFPTTLDNLKPISKHNEKRT